MIIKFSHIAFSSPAFERDRTFLKTLGFKERFVVRSIANPKIKRALMDRYMPVHDFGLFDAPSSLSMELIDQGRHDSTYSSVVPIFEHIPETLVESEGPVSTFGDLRLREVRLKGLKPSAYASDRQAEAKEGPVFRSMVLRTLDIAESIHLFEFLGLHTASSEDGKAVLTFRSPFQADTLTVCLEQDPSARGHLNIDEYGFNHAVLISSAPATDRESLLREGFEVTEIEQIEFNDTRLDIFFIRPQSMSPIEIIGIKK